MVEAIYDVVKLSNTSISFYYSSFISLNVVATLPIFEALAIFFVMHMCTLYACRNLKMPSLLHTYLPSMNIHACLGLCM